jgi:hypothetical protein
MSDAPAASEGLPDVGAAAYKGGDNVSTSGSIDHVETLPENQASEQSLTRFRICRRVSLDGKRCLRINQRSVGQYTTALAEPRNLSW